MKFVVLCRYKDTFGAGFFTLNAPGNGVSWGYGPDTHYFETEDKAKTAADNANSRDTSLGFSEIREKWTIVEIGK